MTRTWLCLSLCLTAAACERQLSIAPSQQCRPADCSALGRQCGEADDGCGGTVSCGGCAAPLSCGESGRCSCQPTTCAAKGATCGELPDGCGGVLECGGCSQGEVCGGTTPNQCGRYCNDGICFEPGFPRAYLYGVRAFSSSDVWVVGEKGLILRWNGRGWQRLHAGRAHLSCIWGASSSDVWIGGKGRLQHWDGQGFTAFPLERVTSIAGIDARDVWFASASTPVHRWDGIALRAAPGAGIVYRLHASAGSGVWGAGASALTHWDGQRWTNVPYPSETFFAGPLWGRSATDVRMLEGDALWSWDGIRWVSVEVPALVPRALWGEGQSLWMGGMGLSGFPLWRWDGVTVSRGVADAAPDVNAIDGAPDGSLWAVGNGGNVLRFDGQLWRTQPHAAQSNFFGFTALWGTGDEFFGLERAGSSGASRLVHWRGGVREDGPAAFVDVLSGASATNVWAVGTQVRRWDGVAWREVSPPSGVGRLTAVHAVSPARAWVGDQDGRVFSFDNGRWRALPQVGPPAWLSSIWGTSADDVWVATFEPSARILKWEGGRWVEQWRAAPDHRPHLRFAGGSPTDLWTTDSVQLQYDGATWRENPQLNGTLHVADDGEWWGVVDSRSILRRTSEGWRRVGDAPSEVWRLATNAREVMAVGSGGAVMRFPR